MTVRLISSALDIHFGAGYPRENLPAGWTLNESAEDFTFGTSPDGQEYYLGLRRAYPCRRAEKAIGRLKVGDRYIDTENGVIEFANTETERPVTSPGIDQRAESPKGLGRD